MAKEQREPSDDVRAVSPTAGGREKLSYSADCAMPMGAILRNFELDAFTRTAMRHLVEGQSIADTPMNGNVPLKTPFYDWGYTGRLGDEINWGDAIVLVPSLLYELYGDTQTMTVHYDQMVQYIGYIRREKVGTGGNERMVDAALATGSPPTRPQAATLDAGLVTPEHRKEVLDALVELVYAFHPNGDGPHFSGGTIGMAPTVRALAEGGRDDVLWIFSRKTTSLVTAAAG